MAKKDWQRQQRKGKQFVWYSHISAAWPLSRVTAMCVFAAFLIVLVKYLLFVLFIFCWFLYFLQNVLKPLLDIALDISQLQKLTGRDAPTVIT